MTDDVTVRPLRVPDRSEWAALWRGYLAFYRAELTDDVTEHTWAALTDPAAPVHGLVAVAGGRVVGLAHVVLHATTWATRSTCYLEDLYVDRGVRGAGLGRALITAVYAFADEHEASGVYWLTQEYNAPARSLYDTVAHRSSFVVYQR
ncbi:GNAT family N-acetyltransferase [Nakamurella sp.]|uniref:GNAT family N-acetyltransferase n=1 Tax=Nakamurella sp. TaxID=1869182 RepID=UPI003B3ABB67